MIKDSIHFSGKIPIKGINYEENEDTFTIFNVPILATMVQTYSDGNAFKSTEEILKVEVNNIPLTIVDETPTHPEHLSSMNTIEKKSVTVGYMSEPVNLHDSASKTKRYADFVLYNTPKIDAIKKDYLEGKYIDTSIGFRFKKDETKGEFLGLQYDYIQRDIILDHNAILIDRVGNHGIGRMPSPIGGIGADNFNMEEKIKMSEKDLQTQVDSLTKENESMKKELDSFKAADIDSLKKSLDESKVEIDKVKVELKDSQDTISKLEADLKVYKVKEEEVLNSKKDELKKHYVEFADLIEKADSDYINTKYDELQKKKTEKKDIGTDMMGVNKQKSDIAKEQENFNKVYGKKVK